ILRRRMSLAICCSFRFAARALRPCLCATDAAAPASRTASRPLPARSRDRVSVRSEGGRDMEFRLLGPLEVRKHGREVAVAGAKQRALLAMLLVHAGEVVSRDRLIEELWRDRPPGT